MYETMSSLEFDNKFVQKIYDDKEHTVLDYFFQNKPNHQFNEYLRNIQRNETKLNEYQVKAKLSPRNELSQRQKQKYAEMRDLEK